MKDHEDDRVNDNIKFREKLDNAFKGYLPMISLENEVAAWSHISKVVDKALAKYPTTMEEDYEIL